LIGRKLLLYLNADDLRSVRAFLPDGTELGVLNAQGAWGVMPHNLKLRQEILKLRGRRPRAGIDSNPIEVYVQAKLAQAKKSRRAANDLAQTVRILAGAPTVRTPAGPVGATVSPAAPAVVSVVQKPADVAPAPTPRTGIRARKLSIGSGQVF
jgi:putative transposase